MRKSREILEYRWQEMTVIASDTYEDVVISDGNSADEDAESALHDERDSETRK